MIVDVTYFEKEPLFLPNISDNADLVSSNETYQSFIDKYEFDFLLTSLGYTLAKELLNQFEANGDWKVSALQKWKDLVDGVDNWRGLRFDVGGYKTSMIANYVYCQYLFDNATSLTAVGAVIDSVEKGNRVTSLDKIANAWQEMYLQRQGERQDGTLTLEEYLKENEVDFVDYKFQYLHNINSFNL